MADRKERDDRSRRRDNIRQLQEQLQNMELEKRRQEKEMQERIQMLEMENARQQEENEMLEMENHRQEEQDEFEMENREPDFRDSVRQVLDFSEETDTMRASLEKRDLTTQLVDLRESVRRSMRAQGESIERDHQRVQLHQDSSVEDTRSATDKEKVEIDTRKKQSPLSMTDLENMSSVSKQTQHDKQIYNDYQEIYRAARQKYKRQLESNFDKGYMTSHLDGSQDKHDMPFDRHGDPDIVKEGYGHDNEGSGDKNDLDQYTPSIPCEDAVTYKSQTNKIDVSHDEMTSLKRQMREDIDENSDTRNKDESYLSVQAEIEREKREDEHKRKVLLQESARLKKERQITDMAIEKERLKEEVWEREKKELEVQQRLREEREQRERERKRVEVVQRIKAEKRERENEKC